MGSSASLVSSFIYSVIEEYFLSARFDEGDPAYEWLILFLVWSGAAASVCLKTEPEKSLDSRERVEELSWFYRYGPQLEEEVGGQVR